VARLIVEYDDDLAGAADALLAVLRPTTQSAECSDEATEDPDDDAA
jgi:hypothetical protein